MRKFLLVVAVAACSGKEASPPSAADALAEAAATKTLPADHYLSPTEKFDVSLPGVWKGHYSVQEKKDTTRGARLAVEFRFVPDSGSKAPSLMLITIRIFAKKTWEALVARGGSLPGAKIWERADEAFVLALPATNPYPASLPEAAIYDRLIISLAQGGQQVHVTARP